MQWFDVLRKSRGVATLSERPIVAARAAGEESGNEPNRLLSIRIAALLTQLTIVLACFPAAAQSIDGKFGLGIEVPYLDLRHTSQDFSVTDPTTGVSSTASVGQTSTQMGLFAAGAGLDGKYGLNNQNILAMRLALRRETSKADGGSTATHSQLSLLPRWEYYVAPNETVRPHLGLEAGYERSTTSGGSGLTSNLWLIGPTGGLSYFPSPNWSVDFSASLYFIAGSQEIAGQSASASGYGGVLRVAFSSWLGGQAQPATAGALGSDGQAGNSAAGQDKSQAPDEPVEVRRISIDLDEGRRWTLATNGKEGGGKLTFTLMKVSDSDELSNCTQVLLHAPGELEVTIEVHYKRISAPSGNLSILTGTTDVGHLRPLTVAPVLTEIMTTPDHWIEACGQRWILTPVMRRQLKDYVDSL